MYLESRDGYRIIAVRPLVTCAETHAHVDVRIDIDLGANPTLSSCQARVRLSAPDGRVFEGTSFSDGSPSEIRVVLDVDHPQRWWPRGFGEPLLHDLYIELCDDGIVEDTARCRVGLRSIAIDKENDSDGEGTSFGLRINDVPIFCRGANWIPDGLFPGTTNPDSIVKRIHQAFDADMNMLRVWGGGVYEDQVFYDTCDQLGILVWQDFMFACATYPEDEPFAERVETEAKYQIGRLAHHASIVMWCGGNENVLAWRNWGWKEKMPGDQAWGRRYFTELLPSVCGALDPSRPFLPDSPWSGSPEADPNDPHRGDRHTWDLKLERIREMVPRFVSEFGHQSPPLRTTIEEALGQDCFESESPSALRAFSKRQRGWGGDAAQYDDHFKGRFPEATSLDQRLVQMHLTQARATSISYEWLRAHGDRWPRSAHMATKRCLDWAFMVIN